MSQRLGFLQEKIKAKDDFVAAIKKDNDFRAEQRKAERKHIQLDLGLM